MNKRKVIGWVLFVAWIGFILWMTLLGRKPIGRRIFRPDLFYEIKKWLNGSADGPRFIRLFLENILLFVPFGYFFPWRKTWWMVLIVSCFFSASIEFTQYLTTLGEFEFDDIIANTLGALIGYILSKVFIILIGRLEGES